MRLQTPEEREADRMAFLALHEEQERKIEDLEALELSPDEPLSEWEQRFARGVVRDWRLHGYLTDRQWAKVDEILKAQEDRE